MGNEVDIAKNLSDGLVITLIGMGLVFASILVLWGLMEVVVRITARMKEAPEEAEEAEAAAPAEATAVEDDTLKQRAAAAAVAVALALQRISHSTLTRPATEALSSWQATFRSIRQGEQSNLTNRKR